MSYNCCAPSYGNQGNSYHSLSSLEQRVTPYFSAQSSPAVRSYSSESEVRRDASVLYSVIDSIKQYVRRAYDAIPQIHFTPEYTFSPDAFLKPNRAPQPFVGEAAQIETQIKDAFFATMGQEFPNDIRVAVLNDKNFNKQISDPGVVGFSLNRREFGLVNDVVVRSGPMDHVLLTIGHEIGHVLTKTLKHKHNEEAKAFAFSRAWMNAIQENDIAGLKHAIVLDNPAHNGLHDVACSFVWRMIRSGMNALNLYWELVRGTVEVAHAY